MLTEEEPAAGERLGQGNTHPSELLPTAIRDCRNGDRRRAESQGRAHSAARACSPSATGLFVAFRFSQDTEFKQNSQKWPWLVQSKPVPLLRGWADL